MRKNKLVELLEEDKLAFGSMLHSGDLHEARRAGESDRAFVVVDLEHQGFDFPLLGDTLQWLISRRQMAREGSARPAPTPIVRVPVNASEHNQWIIKQALDYGAFGLVIPHVQTASDVRAFVGAARYSRGPNAPNPEGHRGVASSSLAMRYWGCETFADYFDESDLWPLNPAGELMLIALVEDSKGFANIGEITRVPGLGGVWFGTGDGSVSLGGMNRDVESVKLAEARKSVATVCREAGVVLGTSGSAEASDIQQRVQEGFRFFIE